MIKTCDRLVYENLLSRDKQCQRCGRTNTLVPSHCHSKKAYPHLRHDLLNLLLLCDKCHRWWHSRPIQSWEWFVQKWEDRYEYLLVEKNKHVKLNKAHHKQRARELRGEEKENGTSKI